jgi:hypothetical protein
LRAAGWVVRWQKTQGRDTLRWKWWRQISVEKLIATSYGLELRPPLCFAENEHAKKEAAYGTIYMGLQRAPDGSTEWGLLVLS